MGAKRFHKQKDPPFWFQGQRQTGFQKPWLVGALHLCGLWSPSRIPCQTDGQPNPGAVSFGGWSCSQLSKALAAGEETMWSAQHKKPPAKQRSGFLHDWPSWGPPDNQPQLDQYLKKFQASPFKKRRREHKDPPNHGFWNPLVLGILKTECRIPMFMQSFGDLSS